jgi:hypothetical protein
VEKNENMRNAYFRRVNLSDRAESKIPSAGFCA